MEAVSGEPRAFARRQQAEVQPGLGDVLDALRGIVLGYEVTRTRRADRGARRQHVDRDAKRQQFRGRALYEAVYRRLDRRIHRRAAVGRPGVVGSPRRQRDRASAR